MPDAAGDGAGVAYGGRDDYGGSLGIGWGEVLLEPADVEGKDDVGEERCGLDGGEACEVDEGVDEVESLALPLKVVEDGSEAVDEGA